MYFKALSYEDKQGRFFINGYGNMPGTIREVLKDIHCKNKNHNTVA